MTDESAKNLDWRPERSLQHGAGDTAAMPLARDRSSRNAAGCRCKDYVLVDARDQYAPDVKKTEHYQYAGRFFPVYGSLVPLRRRECLSCLPEQFYIQNAGNRGLDDESLYAEMLTAHKMLLQLRRAVILSPSRRRFCTSSAAMRGA